MDTIWLAQFAPNGNFMAHFRICDRDDPHDNIETGSWSYSKGIFTLLIKSTNGVSRLHEQQYATMSYDGRAAWHYRYLATGFEFTSIRVRADFELPECGAVS